MFELTYKDLLLHRLKFHSKVDRNVFKPDDTIKIVKTTQGKNLNQGYNINFYVLLFIEYPFVNIYQIGNRIYFEPTADYVNGYKITINDNSAPVTKVSSKENCERLDGFEGHYKANYIYLDGKAMFFIEK